MRIILVSHGSFSKGLFETIEMVLGPQENLAYAGLFPHEGVEVIQNRIEKEIQRANPGEEVLILSDLFYGSPFNAVMALMPSYPVEHLTGINVPLLMEIIMMRGNGLNARQICEQAVELSKNTVMDVNTYLKELMKEENEECETSF